MTVALNALGAQASAQASPEDQQVLDKVEQFIIERSAQDFDGQATVRVLPATLTPLANCQDTDVYMPPGRSLRPQTTVAVRCLGNEASPVYVRADVSIEGSYFVAGQVINPNQTISAEMLEEKTGDLLRLAPHFRVSPDRLIGRIATQRILSGQPVRLTATRGINSVKRGDTVRVEARVQGLLVTSQGEAVNNGDVGDSMQIKLQNGKVIQAVLTESGVAVTSF